MIEAFNTIETVNDPDHIYFNIYTISSDFHPQKPGTDYMGALQHDHVTNNFMEWYKVEGEPFLKRSRIIPGYNYIEEEDGIG